VTICDSTYAAIDLWSLARPDIGGYIEKAAQRTRLRDKKLDDCIQFCLTPDFTDKIPIMNNGVLIVESERNEESPDSTGFSLNS
jgi:2-phosphosulfolactate phosphatase